MSAAARWPRPRLLATGLAALSCLLPVAASATERIAVVLSAENARDAALAENLAEVAIAKLAESASELVGARELSRLLERTRDGETIAACLSESACLVHLRSELSVASIVEGKLRREGTRITLELQLLEADTGKQRRRVSRTSDDAVAELVEATREGVDELFRRAPGAKVADAPPMAAPLPTLRSYKQAVTGPTPVLVLPPQPPPPTPPDSLRTTVAYGSATVAALSLSAAVVFGVLARQQPSGATRLEAQDKLEQQRAFATTANVLWISSGVFTAISVLAFSPIGRNQAHK
jgi:TolB-like protein